MNSEDVLNAVLSSVEGLKREIDQDVRADFNDFGEWLDVFIEGLDLLNKQDFLILTEQLQKLTEEVIQGAKCQCDGNTRWHFCLSRIDSAFQRAARECNINILRMCLEEKGLDMSIIDLQAFDVVEHPLDDSAPLKVKVPDYVPEEFTND